MLHDEANEPNVCVRFWTQNNCSVRVRRSRAVRPVRRAIGADPRLHDHGEQQGEIVQRQDARKPRREVLPEGKRAVGHQALGREVDAEPADDEETHDPVEAGPEGVHQEVADHGRERPLGSRMHGPGHIERMGAEDQVGKQSPANVDLIADGQRRGSRLGPHPFGGTRPDRPDLMKGPGSLEHDDVPSCHDIRGLVMVTPTTLPLRRTRMVQEHLPHRTG